MDKILLQRSRFKHNSLWFSEYFYKEFDNNELACRQYIKSSFSNSNLSTIMVLNQGYLCNSSFVWFSELRALSNSEMGPHQDALSEGSLPASSKRRNYVSILEQNANLTLFSFNVSNSFCNIDMCADAFVHLVSSNESNGHSKNSLHFNKVLKEWLSRIKSMNGVKGFQYHLSGRFGGSKLKGQKARTQKERFGCTGLTSFSSVVRFTRRDINTAYGIVGLKLWIIYYV